MKMRQKTVYLLVFMLVFSTAIGTMASSNNLNQFKAEPTEFADFSHTILGEFGTATTCEPCKYAHSALKIIDANKEEWEYPVWYISLVRNKNAHAYARSLELNLYSEPTVFWDGGYEEDQGATSVEQCLTMYNQSIKACGLRDVADIDIDIDVDWLGAVNRVPEDGETEVEILPTLAWNLSAMNLSVTVDNNEASQYNGHLHVYVTEYSSSYWLDKFHLPYTYALLDYAWNEDVQISSGGTWQDSMIWDGLDYDNGKSGDEKEVFDEIFQDNTVIIASVFDEDTEYSDETAGIFAGYNTFPKEHDIYLGTTNPPQKIESNQSALTFAPSDTLEWNTTYYWKIVTWNNLDEKEESSVFSFTTRDNHPPNVPSTPFPLQNATNVPIDVNLTWNGGDPDNDTVYYDVYFGKEFPPDLYKENISETYCDPFGDGRLEFQTRYFWKIVAWDRFGANSESKNWTFLTQANVPPKKPKDPVPANGANGVPIEANLTWIGGDPNQGDFVDYKIYFEKDDPDPEYIGTIEDIDAVQSEIIYDLPYDMEIFKTYYWKIDAIDSKGLTTEGDVWHFSTGINDPPIVVITGPSKVKEGVETDYTFTITDPENDPVWLKVNWGDGNITDWMGNYSSPKMVNLSHSWSPKGNVVISAKAKDPYQEGDPDTHAVKVPYINSFTTTLLKVIQNLMQRFPILKIFFSIISVGF